MPLGIITGIRDHLAAITTTEARIVASAFILVLAVVIGHWLLPRMTRRLIAGVRSRVSGRTAGAIDTFSDSFPWHSPLIVLVRAFQLVVYAVIGMSLFVVWGRWDLAVELLTTLRSWLPLIGRIGLTVALFVTAWIGANILENVIHGMTEEFDRVSAHQEQLTYRLVQLGLFTMLGFAVLTLWEIDLSGLLVGAGFLGIVIGLAARQTIGSLVAGIVLMFSRPFEIGDWVEIGDEEGIVTEISVINTRLRSFDGEYVAIPNDRVGDSVVRNLSREGTLRVRAEVGVDYGSDPKRAAEIALETIREVDAVVNNPTPDVVPRRFGDSSVVLEMRFWIDRPTPQRKWRALRNVILEVKSAFEREGIKIPFPQRELTGRAETGGFRVADEGRAGGEGGSGRGTPSDGR